MKKKKLLWLIIALIELPILAGIFVLEAPYNLYSLVFFVIIPYLTALIKI